MHAIFRAFNFPNISARVQIDDQMRSIGDKKVGSKTKRKAVKKR
jgi:hypothetical protein